MTDKLIQQLKEEAETVGYTMCTIDVKDILIKMKEKYPCDRSILFEISDEMDRAAALRKDTGMAVRESDLGN